MSSPPALVNSSLLDSLAEAFNPEDLDEKDLPEWVGEEKTNFDMVLDRDQNGRLDRDEIRHWMVPDDATMFDVEARHLFYNADTNKVC